LINQVNKHGSLSTAINYSVIHSKDKSNYKPTTKIPSPGPRKEREVLSALTIMLGFHNHRNRFEGRLPKPTLI